MQVSQAAFAKLMNVSRKTVTKWKDVDRIVMSGDKVDVEASRERLLRYSSSDTKAHKGAVALRVDPGGAVPTDRAIYADRRQKYPNPANLPEEITMIATAIDGGAFDLGLLLLPRLPKDDVRAIVTEWVRQQRRGWVGDATLAPEDAGGDDWPPPPIGFARWADHPMFTGPALSAEEWEELAAEATTARQAMPGPPGEVT